MKFSRDADDSYGIDVSNTGVNSDDDNDDNNDNVIDATQDRDADDDDAAKKSDSDDSANDDEQEIADDLDQVLRAIEQKQAALAGAKTKTKTTAAAAAAAAMTPQTTTTTSDADRDAIKAWFESQSPNAPLSQSQNNHDATVDDDGVSDDEVAAVPSNEDLLYDPDDDVKTQKWVDNERRKHNPQHTQNTSERQSDAILSCPCCLSIVCIDCQIHDQYPNQFRAMFLHRQSCFVQHDQVLRQQATDTAKEAMFWPVRCVHCNTEVGVMDEDEIYHLFNVVPSQA